MVHITDDTDITPEILGTETGIVADPSDNLPSPSSHDRRSTSRILLASLAAGATGLVGGATLLHQDGSGDKQAVVTPGNPNTDLGDPSASTITVAPTTTESTPTTESVTPTTIFNNESLDYAAELYIKDGIYEKLATNPGHILDGVSLTAYNGTVAIMNPVVVVVRSNGNASVDVIYDFQGRQLEENEQFVLAAPREGTDILDLVLPGQINAVYISPNAALRQFKTSGGSEDLQYINDDGLASRIKSIDFGNDPSSQTAAMIEASKSGDNQQITLDSLIDDLLARATA